MSFCLRWTKSKVDRSNAGTDTDKPTVSPESASASLSSNQVVLVEDETITHNTELQSRGEVIVVRTSYFTVEVKMMHTAQSPKQDQKTNCAPASARACHAPAGSDTKNERQYNKLPSERTAAMSFCRCATLLSTMAHALLQSSLHRHGVLEQLVCGLIRRDDIREFVCVCARAEIAHS